MDTHRRRRGGGILKVMAQLGLLAKTQWRDDLRIGDETIDAQHKGFVDQAQRIGGLIAAGAPATQVLSHVAAMVAATKHHFTTEDALLKAIGYPDLASHRIDHAVIVDQVSDLVAPLTVLTPADEVVTVVRSIVAILLEHLMLKDMEFRPFLQAGTWAGRACPALADGNPGSRPGLL